MIGFLYAAMVVLGFWIAVAIVNGNVGAGEFVALALFIVFGVAAGISNDRRKRD